MKLGAFAALLASLVALVANAVVAQPPPRGARVAGFFHQETIVGGADPSDRLPLVIALHQLGAGPRNAGRVFDEGMTCGARVVAPRGTLRHAPGFSFIDALAADPPSRLDPELRRGAGRLARFISAVRRARPTEGPTIVTGFSQGGMLTFALAALHPEVVDAAFPGAGFLPPSLRPREGDDRFPEIVAFHGARDTIIDHRWARDTVAHLSRLGVSARLETHDRVGHRFTRAMRRALRGWVDGALRERGACETGDAGLVEGG